MIIGKKDKQKLADLEEKIASLSTQLTAQIVLFDKLDKKVVVFDKKFNEMADLIAEMKERISNLEKSYQELHDAYVKRDEMEKPKDEISFQPRHGYRFGAEVENG